MAATLLRFAEVNDRVAATTKKLVKQAALAEYLQSLSDEDLKLAVRFLAGRAFPVTSERTLNVGSASLYQAIGELLRLPREVLGESSVRAGEIGEALSTLWPGGAGGESVITLGEIEEGFEMISGMSSQEGKRSVLVGLFSRCKAGREAAYLAKIISGDMRTGVQDGLLLASIAQAFSRTLAAVQRAHLLVGDIEEVAALAREDALEKASFRLFHPLQFMLATPQETAGEVVKTMGGETFFIEDKLDGIRAQIHKRGEQIHIYTRTMDRTDASFPDVVEKLRRIPHSFLLDGEIVPYANGQVLPFAHIQRRLGRKVLTPKILAANPCAFIAFDLLYLDGELLLDVPLRVRREKLEGIGGLVRTEVLEVCSEEQIVAAFEAARGRRNEGAVLKDPGSSYSPGRRGKAWLKLKTHLPTLDCVVTAVEYGHGKRKDVLSDYTFAVWSDDPALPGAKLVNLGKSFTGLTDAEIAEMTRMFLSIATETRGRTLDVMPTVVIEVAFDQIQTSARHASGYALRFPRIKRLRPDKLPADADRLGRVAEIHQSQLNFAFGPDVIPAAVRMPTLFDHLDG